MARDRKQIWQNISNSGIKLSRTWLACDLTETKGRRGMDQVPRDAKEHVVSGQGWSRVQ